MSLKEVGHKASFRGEIGVSSAGGSYGEKGFGVIEGEASQNLELLRNRKTW